jgi:hypothetical protein
VQVRTGRHAQADRYNYFNRDIRNLFDKKSAGFITDITGFIFLIPAGRKIVKKYLLKWLKGKIKEDNFYFREF